MTSAQVERRDKAPRRGNHRAATALRLAGASWSEIAETLEYDSAARAKAAVLTDLAIIGSDREGRDQLRDVEGARLDRLLRSLWARATNPQDPEHISASRACLQIIDRRIKLYGLDAPEEIVVHTPTSLEIDKWVSSLLQAQHGDVIEGEVVEAQ